MDNSENVSSSVSTTEQSGNSTFDISSELAVPLMPTVGPGPNVDTFYNFRLVCFQAGNRIFRVLQNQFEEPGTIFEAMFSLPRNDGEASLNEGSSLENPILLHGVSEDHFRGFLGALCPFDNIKMTNDDWIGALKLATMWEFSRIRKKAIKALDTYVANVAAKEAVLLAKNYRVAVWLRNAYSKLICQNFLSMEDLSTSPALDWETTARIFCVREMIFRSTRSPSTSRLEDYRRCVNRNCKVEFYGKSNYCDNCSSMSPPLSTDDIPIASFQTIFGPELETMKEAVASEAFNPPLPAEIAAAPISSDLRKEEEEMKRQMLSVPFSAVDEGPASHNIW